MRKLSLLLVLLIGLAAKAQDGFPINGSVSSTDEIIYALEGAMVQTDYAIKPAVQTILIQKGKIIGIGAGIAVPKNAVREDLSGLYIYPSFVELKSEYGLEKAKRSEWKPRPQYDSNKPGAYAWNEAIKPEYRADQAFTPDGKAAEGLRKLGFGAALIHRHDGIARGSGAVVALGDQVHQSLLLPKASAHFSFSKGSSRQSYPSSLMGSIALLKQMCLDADWYRRGGFNESRNLSLEAWNELTELPAFMDPGDYLSSLRADRMGDEFDQQFIMYGSGDEYKRIKDVKATNAPYVLPLQFPDAFDVSDPYASEFLSLERMKHWELAPANPAFFEKNSIEFALSAAESGDFWSFLRKSIEFGLSEEAALKALTYTPAKLINADKMLGSLSKGKYANLLVCSTPLFEDDMKIVANYVLGKKHQLQALAEVDVRGTYDANINGMPFNLDVTGTPERPSAKATKDSTDIETSFDLSFSSVTMSLYHDSILDGTYRLSGYYQDGKMKGNVQLPNGDWARWSATRTDLMEEDEGKDEETSTADQRELGKVWFPNMAYGLENTSLPNNVLIKNATVWTGEKDGILKETDVLVKDGKIASIGKGLSAGGATVIDGTGMHLTAGIIDEHSHIAISRGVNESGQNSSAEVSIGDVVNPDDINIYRQLAGGVTAAQLLHGSANPIGGQSALIKLRWGSNGEDMQIKGADGFIKFALGENVKQSNWGSFQTVRYPQTRMGVEQTFYDYFWRAKDYEKAKASAAKSKTPFRRDLEMECLVEILNSERFISCHSYIQSEINMLMHVADSMGFTLNTFTHILEGYKVADKMKEHGAGASTFSDWWAYKYEVNEAIPYNASIMNAVGLTVAINSDDAEMARRLNQEAAKGIKYGGMTEEEAWNMVTLNPAKLLHLDDRMGSIKQGKDADLVLWTDNPLSIYAQVNKTFVDGKCLYDATKNEAEADRVKKERMRLINLMLDAKAGGDRVQEVKPVNQQLYHCDTLEDH